MRRTIATVLALGLLVAPAGAPAGAKKKAGAKPVKTELYLHGYSAFGEVDGADWLVNGSPAMKMTPDDPTESFPRSMTLNTPGLNTQCTGLPAGFPTWVGNISGTVTGDVTLTAGFAGAGTFATARLWVDIPVFSCNESYVPANHEVVFELAPGQSSVDIVFEDVKLTAQSLIMIELLGSGARGTASRVLYDSGEAPSVLSFKCIPASGKSCA